MAKYLLLFFISTQLFAGTLYSELLDLSLNNNYGLVFDFVNFLAEDGSVELLEKKKIVKKTEYRREVVSSAKGYLGAVFNSRIQKVPYAYIFVVKHSGEEVKNEFLENNQIRKILDQLNNKNYNTLNYHSNSLKSVKFLQKNQYEVVLSIYLSEYTNDKFKSRNLIYAKLIIEIKNDPYFYFYVNDLTLGSVSK